MGITTDVLNVRLTAEERGFIGTMNSASSAVKNLGATLAGLGLGAFLKETVTVAGELEQNLGGAEAVFKSFAAGIQDTASKAYSALGLSQSQYLATANKMGALFQGSGFSISQSAEMTTVAMQRAADVASIMGVEINSAMEAVAGAAKGNFTMMDNLGVAINDTTLQIYAQEKGLGRLETTQQKVNAAMQMFIEKTDYAAGNYAKENDTYAGSLQTLKAEFQNTMAEIGTTLMPVAQTALPLIRTVVSDLKPVVLDVSRGIATMSTALGLLEDPSVRAVVYLGAATMAISKLNAVAGTTASGLVLLGSGLMWLLGKWSAEEEKLSEATSTVIDTAGAAADRAAASTDNFTDSLNEANAAAVKLASFDEITKLSGDSGSSIASKIATSADLDTINDIISSTGDLQAAIDDVNSQRVDFEAMFSGAEKHLGNIKEGLAKALSIDPEEQLAGLRILNSEIETLFGPEFTSFWKGVGSDIYDVFNGTETDSYNALLRLNEKIKTIPFAATINEIAIEIGKNLSEGVRDVTEGFDKLQNGDFAGAMASFSTAVEKNSALAGTFAEPLGKAAGVSADYFTALSEGDTTAANQVLNGFSKNVHGGLNYANNWMLDSILASDYIKINPLTKQLPEMAVWWDNTFRNFGAGLYNFENAASTAVAEVMSPAPPASASDIHSILNSISGTNTAAGPIQVILELDGEKVAESVINYQDNQVTVTNGR